MKQNNTLYLKGLNELRAIAALAVLFHHVELFKYQDTLSYSFYNNKFLHHFFENLGKNGVYLFFVLSGFLITYLIIKEKEKYGNFDFKKFYIRRILRIWPLYFIIMIISFFLIPFLDYNFNLFLLNERWHDIIKSTNYFSPETIISYWGFLSNYGLRTGITVVGASQSWSVSIEEQFYLFWPVFLLVIFRKHKMIFTGILISTILLINQYFNPLFFQIFQFEYLFIGCLGALFANSNYFQKIKKHLDKKKIYLSVIAIIVVLLAVPIISIAYIQTILLSFFFLILIVLTINNTFYFKSKVMDNFGKISYGIYMYHPFIMFLIFPVIEKYVSDKIVFFILSYALITIFTLIISHLSYLYIEKKFLTLKEKKYSKL